MLIRAGAGVEAVELLKLLSKRLNS